MSHQYVPIGWNGQKRVYDAALVIGLLLYVSVFVGVGTFLFPTATAETLLIRGFGSCAFLFLTIVLCIGPLCRLDPRFLPFLYNRRHLGVTTFLLGLIHGVFSIVQFHSQGDTDPIVSLFLSNTNFRSLPDFPFQILGFFALIILFLMAATSHDFWLRNLTPPVWKALHMLVYIAYALLVAHITLGLLQSERSPWLVMALSLDVVLVISLHIAASFRESKIDTKQLPEKEAFVVACPVDSIEENSAKVFSVQGERIAVFRYGGKISAISNVCRHQNGPLGEGKIIDGCVTCPWHGYQYLPQNGQSPPPFTEKVSTFRTRLSDGMVLLDPRPLPPGTPIEPTIIP